MHYWQCCSNYQQDLLGKMCLSLRSKEEGEEEEDGTEEKKIVYGEGNWHILKKEAGIYQFDKLIVCNLIWFSLVNFRTL